MICVRCLQDSAGKIADAPDGSGEWEVYYCERCNYGWRSSEEDEITAPEKRDPIFQLDKVDLNSLQILNPIPPLKK
jgi:vanillate/4-hydroxybenzoate decarboxylase subunit D